MTHRTNYHVVQGSIALSLASIALSTFASALCMKLLDVMMTDVGAHMYGISRMPN